MKKESAEEENFWGIYSYKRLDGSKGYMAFSEKGGRSASHTLRELLELRPVASYGRFYSNSKIPILRMIMHHSGSERTLRSKIEKILRRDK